METKTIGKFISALRKANGMTQKELAEKLFVSDKTISRWECDECTPDLSLIPLIADIFEITADELLRGERINHERERLVSEQSRKCKSEKQFKHMLDKAKRNYQNLSLISLGITILGVIVATIFNVGFSAGLLAFCLCTVFCVASEIAQLCFYINAHINIDEDDDTYNDKINRANTENALTLVKLSFVNIATFAFSLPLVTLINGANYGMSFESWLVYGTLFSVMVLIISYIIYVFAIHKILTERGIIILTQKDESKVMLNKTLLKRVLSIAIIIALVLCIGIIVINSIGKHGFIRKLIVDNCDDFKKIMETDYDSWYKDGYSYIQNGNIVNSIPAIPSDKENEEDYFPQKEYAQILNSNGEIICEYYYNPNLYREINFTESSHDKMPVTVITTQAYYNGIELYRSMLNTFYTLIVIDFIVAAFIYIRKAYRAK